MIAIANVDKNLGIGCDNKLLIYIKDDMNYFKEQTTNNIIIMGKNTLFSFKEKKPLNNRLNIVFTKDKSIKGIYKDYDNILFVNDRNELFDILSNYKNKKHFVIGGESIYKLLINDCDTLLLTEVDTSFKADKFFPDYNKLGFKETFRSEDKYIDNIKYNFVTYKK